MSGLAAERAAEVSEGAKPDDGADWPFRAGGLPYLRFLRRMHETLKPETYFEIGTETGKSLKRAPGRAIAVDPAFRLKHEVLGKKPALHLFRQTSDDFFASGIAPRIAPGIDLAFLDGMHLFEFLLRDFINTERLCNPGAVIAIHDVVPITRIAAEREWDRKNTVSWTGDVWKIVPVLRRHRPDLTVRVADCAPSGLAVITGLDPENNDLSDAYDEIVAEWRDLTIDEFGTAALAKALAPVPAHGSQFSDVIGTPARPAAPAIRPPRRISLRIQAPTARRAPGWGEYHLAQGLAAALSRRGVEAAVQPREAWDDRPTGQVDFVLWGLRQEYPHRKDRPAFFWLLYGGETLTEVEAALTEHVFVASRPMARRLARQWGGGKASALLQGFDAAAMSPDGPAEAHGALYVANNFRNRLRPTVKWADEQKVAIEVYGRNWRDTPAEPYLKDEAIPNAELARHYRGAGVVLNDHRNAMGRQGFVSNRIFDALACGAPVVSDPVAGVPDDMAPWVQVCEAPEQFAPAVSDALAEDAARRSERRAFARDAMGRHSLDARVATILDRLNG